MKINIVCDEANGGWIYSEFINQIKKYSSNDILVNEKDPNKYDVVHYIPYYNYQQISKPSTCWLSHQENKQPLHDQFVKVAQAVDVGLSHSKKYANMLRDNHQRHNIMPLMPGVDLKRFTLRSPERPKNDKIVVGYVGRQYTSSQRKNPTLLDKISKLPFVDFRTTGGNLKPKDIPAFYKGLDVVVSPATIEGGPMCLIECLACGVPAISIKGVGVTDQLGEGIIKADNNDDFIAKLKDLWMSKQYITHWRQPSVMNKMRQQVEKYTWEKFVFEHDKVWEMITANSWRKSKE